MSPRQKDTGSGYLYRQKYRTADGTVKLSPWWWISWSEGGKQRRESSRSKKKAVAEQLLHRRLAARSTGERKDLPLSLAELIALVAADHEANRRKSAPKVEQRGKALKRLLGAETMAGSIDEATVTNYTARRLRDGAAPATVNRELALLRRGFRLAMKARRLSRRPEITLLREDNVRRGFVERDQIDAIKAHLPAELRPVVEVAYLTGWRMASELLTRERRHLDLDAGWLRLDTGETKSGRGRQVPLFGQLRAVLEEQEAHTRALEMERGVIIPWLFHREGRRIRSIRHAWKVACTAAGLPGILVHDLRRSAVRNLERAGIARSAAMAIVGHETESVYRRYSIVDEAVLREAGDKLDSKLAVSTHEGRKRKRP